MKSPIAPQFLAAILSSGHAPALIDLELANDDESFEFRGSGANDHLGGDSAQSLRTIVTGDINNDGYDDIILNSSYAEESGRSNSGQVYTILGRGYSPTSLDIETSGGSVAINISSRSGRTVTIELADDLSGPWTEVDTFNTGTSDGQVIDSLGSGPKQFYRAKINPDFSRVRNPG